MTGFTRWFKRLGLALAGFLVVAQLVRPARTNPPVESDVEAAPEVKAVLRRACYDCHSHETVWPWYARVAPVSWLLAHDVNEGRRELNYSRWATYDPRNRVKKLRETVEEVREGEMPPWYYVLLHPDARLSDADRARLDAWAAATR
ncbi:MAG TPA: heme-binding domain-containing protein [Candidatus Binatia bacterium]|jgi:cytochrome c551/c552|nr:heme-binding domain-containing protein [Candidatus Binatia bacterium]